MEAEADKRRGGDGRAELVALLRQTLLEEQLISADLKKKLQTVKKQNVALTQQSRNETTQQSQNETQTPKNGNQEQSPSVSGFHSAVCWRGVHVLLSLHTEVQKAQL